MSQQGPRGGQTTQNPYIRNCTSPSLSQSHLRGNASPEGSDLLLLETSPHKGPAVSSLGPSGRPGLPAMQTSSPSPLVFFAFLWHFRVPHIFVLYGLQSDRGSARRTLLSHWRWSPPARTNKTVSEVEWLRNCAPFLNIGSGKPRRPILRRQET